MCYKKKWDIVKLIYRTNDFAQIEHGILMDVERNCYVWRLDVGSVQICKCDAK